MESDVRPTHKSRRDSSESHKQDWTGKKAERDHSANNGAGLQPTGDDGGGEILQRSQVPHLF